MSRRYAFCLLAFLLVSKSLIAQNPLYCGCIDCPKLLPDNYAGNSTFSVGAAANNDLANAAQGVCGVRLQFSHEYVGDLNIVLLSPAGQSVQLLGPQGLFGATDYATWDVLFTTCASLAAPDPGLSSVWNNDQPWGLFGAFTGIYYPASGCLEDFDSGPVTGDWVLQINDVQGSDAGYLFGFEVLFCDTTGVHCQEPLPEAGVLAGPGSGCAPLTVQTQVLTSAHVSSWHWFFPGATPSESFEMTPATIYDTAGVFPVSLIVANETGADTIFVDSIMVAPGLLNPSFSMAIFGDSIVCTNTTQGYDYFDWTLNGGLPTGQNTSPQVFMADTSGTYDIALNVFNTCDTEIVMQQALVMLSGEKHPEAEGWNVQLFPNPNDGRFSLSIHSVEPLLANISVWNVLGEVLVSESIGIETGDNRYPVNLEDLSAGVYVLHVQTGGNQKVFRFVLVR